MSADIKAEEYFVARYELYCSRLFSLVETGRVTELNKRREEKIRVSESLHIRAMNNTKRRNSFPSSYVQYVIRKQILT